MQRVHPSACNNPVIMEYERCRLAHANTTTPILGNALMLSSFDYRKIFSGVRITSDAFFSVIDCIAAACQCSTNVAASKFRRMKDDDNYNITYECFQFPGQRQRPTPVATLIQLNMIFLHFSLRRTQFAQYIWSCSCDIANHYRAGSQELLRAMQISGARLDVEDTIRQTKLNSMIRKYFPYGINLIVFDYCNIPIYRRIP